MSWSGPRRRRPMAFADHHRWATDATPDQVWAVVADLPGHLVRWPWLDGGALPPLRSGARAAVTVRPPLPYDLHLDLTAVEVVAGRSASVAVDGDLRGSAELVVDGDGDGTRVDLRWHLVVRRPLLQVLAVTGRPALVWGHRWVIATGARQLGEGTGVVLAPTPADGGADPGHAPSTGPGGEAVDGAPSSWLVDGLAGGAVGAVVSGAPSTAHAVATGRPPLAAARAAGALLGSPGLVRGAVAHVALSLSWGAVLGAVLPRRRTALAGAVAGGAIALVDLGVVGRRVPSIRALPVLPQVLDHLAFGAVVGAVVAGRRRARTG